MAFAPLRYSLGLMMQAVVGARNGLYEAGFFRQHRLPRPVISIGNLSLGGEGKTPLVIYIAAVLHEYGVIGALLSRGYGRLHSERRHILAPGNEVPSPWKNIGDEPAVIRCYAPELWVGISRDRYVTGCEIAERARKVVFILDDGFQHRSVYRDLDVVIIDCSKNLPQNRVFPLGTLREPVTSLSRAHAVVLNTGPDGHLDDPVERLVRKVNAAVPIFHCRQEIDATIPLQDWQASGQRRHSVRHLSSAFLVAAIGNPARFCRDVKASGIRISGSRFYRDHRRISAREWFNISKAARESGAEAILTTEKDAIKLAHPLDFPIAVARQATRMLEAQDFQRLILNTIGAFIEAH